MPLHCLNHMPGDLLATVAGLQLHKSNESLVQSWVRSDLMRIDRLELDTSLLALSVLFP